MFIDILEKIQSEDIDQNTSNSKRITVMMKYTICGQNVINNARTSNSKIHVGDVVKFAGAFETNDKKWMNNAYYNTMNLFMEFYRYYVILLILMFTISKYISGN